MLKLHGISKKYENIQAITDFNMEIARGKTYGLVGPNGAGKTTILKIIAGILYFDKGRIWVEENEVDYNRWSRNNVIFIPSGERGLHIKNSVYDNILNYGILKGRPRSEIVANIEKYVPMLGMSELQFRRVEQLSMGEKKRTSILCGLCSGMDIILLDEPSIGVDIDGIEELKKILKIISEKTQTILVISSHDIKFLSEVAQEYIFVFKGKREHVYKGCISDNTIIEHYNKLKGGHNDDAYS